MTRGKRFYITFIYDYLRYTRVYLMLSSSTKMKWKINEVRKFKNLELIGEESMCPTPLILFVKIMGSFTKLLLLISLSLIEYQKGKIGP